MDLESCRGADPPNLVKFSRKINGNLQTFGNFHKFLPNFHLKTLILIEIKASLMEFRKSLIALKEIMIPGDKSLRVWGKSL